MSGVRHWRPTDAAAHLTSPGFESDKYRRGVLGIRTGSAAYPGAAVLGAEAAWRTGIGLLRYTPPLFDDPPALGLPSPAAAVLAARPETVFTSGEGPQRARSDAWLVGSGSDPARRSSAENDAIRALLTGDEPVVVDAGALGLLLDRRPAAPTIATPHRGEFLVLWRAAGLGDRPDDWPEPRDRTPAEGALAAAARTLAERLGISVLLKGARTVSATPDGIAIVAGPATSWLAAAGTGDVLAGILGALAATHAAAIRANHSIFGELGATAALLHDLAARRAARDPHGSGTGHPIAALDVAHALPETIAELRNDHGG